jgi:hypothetical protein
METSEKYRQFAEECERLAKQANDGHHSKLLRETAEVWRKLADAAHEKTDRSRR